MSKIIFIFVLIIFMIGFIIIDKYYSNKSPIENFDPVENFDTETISVSEESSQTNYSLVVIFALLVMCLCSSLIFYWSGTDEKTTQTENMLHGQQNNYPNPNSNPFPNPYILIVQPQTTPIYQTPSQQTPSFYQPQIPQQMYYQMPQFTQNLPPY